MARKLKVRIDHMRLPKRVLIDTCVMIAAVEPGSKTIEPEESAALIEALARTGSDILISSLSLAEFLRGTDAEPPDLDGLIFVDFCSRSARIAATTMSQFSKRVGHRMIFPIDTMIVAIAKVHSATVITTDADMMTIAEAAGVKCFRPSDLIDRQISIDD